MASTVTSLKEWLFQPSDPVTVRVDSFSERTWRPDAKRANCGQFLDHLLRLVRAHGDTHSSECSSGQLIRLEFSFADLVGAPVSRPRVGTPIVVQLAANRPDIEGVLRKLKIEKTVGGRTVPFLEFRMGEFSFGGLSSITVTPRFGTRSNVASFDSSEANAPQLDGLVCPISR